MTHTKRRENAGVGSLKGENRMEKKIMFWARECPHCRNMIPLVDKLEEETDVKLERLEIWHNDPKCGGQLRTPTFFDTETNDVICGEVEYEKLKEWALK
jgi:thiol-disulfide isomerase/thioredoxin